MKSLLYRLVSGWIYGFLTGLTRVVVYTFARWTVEGAEHIPTTGPVVLVSNHLHLLDPPLLAACSKRRVHPMAKRELFETPLVGWVLWPYGAFPVRRFSADMGALRAARGYLRNGHVVLMFPEGTRSKDARLHPALPGAAMVALLADAPVVPVAITGTESIRVPGTLFRWMRRDRLRVHVRFGEPFHLEFESAEARHAERATDLIMRRIAALLPDEYRGAYGPESEGQIVFARQPQDA
ncbi:MAG: 1-acyl-sn-glycerol-3-phosphate acyltransferase [Dehalococcoidia bacterium]|nr:1-acyl-sn-glycerol-3-phosphate acyltransferase [Dehalococcoidia bacterium]HRC61881.1 lysophospholipid acyltransferase family protein [Dehalococcoidia bacterium]